MSPPGEARLITVHSHGADYFYDVVHGALYLGRRLDMDVRVLFMSFESPARRLVRFLTGARGIRQAREEELPFYAKFAHGADLTLSRGTRRIMLTHVRLSLGTRLHLAVRALGSTLGILARSFSGARFRGLSFLEGKCLEAQVGDLAASTFLRGRFGGDRLRPHPHLLYLLWKACYLVHEANRLQRGESSIFTMTPEPSYIHSAPQRFLSRHGAPEASIHLPYSAVELVFPDRKEGTRPTSDPSGALREIEDYFQVRLKDPAKAIYYMTTGQNDNDASEVLDHASRPLKLDAEAVYPVIFLQSLMDAHYLFGVDGFETVADWTFHTIDRCLANPAIAKVLVKPHPAADYLAYPEDAHLFARLERRYQQAPRMVILHPRASLVRLCAATKIVGITKFGSAVEEVVYLGQPAIASRYAPWGGTYRFAQLWSNLEEYDALLDAISPQSWRPPNDAERTDLFRYVVDYRLCELGPEKRFSPVILADLISRASGGPPAAWMSAAYLEHAHRLELLTEGEPMFGRLLDTFEAGP